MASLLKEEMDTKRCTLEPKRRVAILWAVIWLVARAVESQHEVSELTFKKKPAKSGSLNWRALFCLDLSVLRSYF